MANIDNIVSLTSSRPGRCSFMDMILCLISFFLLKIFAKCSQLVLGGRCHPLPPSNVPSSCVRFPDDKLRIHVPNECNFRIGRRSRTTLVISENVINGIFKSQRSHWEFTLLLLYYIHEGTAIIYQWKSYNYFCAYYRTVIALDPDT